MIGEAISLTLRYLIIPLRFMVSQNWQMILPILQVLVIQLSEGVHHLMPIYRGSPTWKEARTDADVAHICIDMYLQQGMNAKEMEAFVKKHVDVPEQSSNVLVIQAKPDIVH